MSVSRANIQVLAQDAIEFLAVRRRIQRVHFGQRVRLAWSVFSVQAVFRTNRSCIPLHWGRPVPHIVRT
ncbi:MAG TPA: hypothetical protein EYQ54_12710 [Myxococcales bacterium]|nr:hypothetical protein [Myxococcales bacterium]HIL80865.1 hypothetical protein [Myxococcales bacterium]